MGRIFSYVPIIVYFHIDGCDFFICHHHFIFSKRWAVWGRRRTWAAARCSAQHSRQLWCCQSEPLSGVLPLEQRVEQDGQADDWGQRMVQRLPGFVPITVTKRFVFNDCCRSGHCWSVLIAVVAVDNVTVFFIVVAVDIVVVSYCCCNWQAHHWYD